MTQIAEKDVAQITRRENGKQRRRLILEAALRIAVREGVRGIRHRAVAKEAGVPLASTTYYFKDIQELINDTFALYAEQALEVVNQFHSRLYNASAGDESKTLIEVLTGPAVISDVIADYMTEYLVEQITQHRDALIAEQAFRYEAILNPQLHALGLVHKKALAEKLTEIFVMMKSPSPAVDASIAISIIHYIEYEGLLIAADDINRDEIRAILLRQLTLLRYKEQ